MWAWAPLLSKQAHRILQNLKVWFDLCQYWKIHNQAEIYKEVFSENIVVFWTAVIISSLTRNTRPPNFRIMLTLGVYILRRIKVGLSTSKKICVICWIESPLKMMKNAFYFILKAFLVLKTFKFLSRLFGHVVKTAWLER